jgi:hypothetical protein
MLGCSWVVVGIALLRVLLEVDLGLDIKDEFEEGGITVGGDGAPPSLSLD